MSTIIYSKKIDSSYVFIFIYLLVIIDIEKFYIALTFDINSLQDSGHPR